MTSRDRLHYCCILFSGRNMIGVLISVSVNWVGYECVDSFTSGSFECFAFCLCSHCRVQAHKITTRSFYKTNFISALSGGGRTVPFKQIWLLKRFYRFSLQMRLPPLNPYSRMALVQWSIDNFSHCSFGCTLLATVWSIMSNRSRWQIT